MIRLDCEQGSPEWIIARLGIPTASRFDKIITPKTMKPSSQMDGLIEKLAAEWALGRQVDDAAGLFMDRGSDMEIDAVRWLELTEDVEVDRVGFVTTDDGTVGCSPDGFIVGRPRGAEIKVPAAHTHVGYLLDPLNLEYRAQIQGCLLVTEREDWWRLSYHPTLPKSLTLFQRDEVFIKALIAALGEFKEKLHEAKERLLKLGVVPIVPALTVESGTPKTALNLNPELE